MEHLLFAKYIVKTDTNLQYRKTSMHQIENHIVQEFVT